MAIKPFSNITDADRELAKKLEQWLDEQIRHILIRRPSETEFQIELEEYPVNITSVSESLVVQAYLAAGWKVAEFFCDGCGHDHFCLGMAPFYYEDCQGG